ncbi:tho complex subunit 5 homolog [Lynx pardinus]|uniref:Tho complex subunit 5 homolog n=1 Tax=Lynx pardinus TaxID=191816 RepID=A0A485MXS7_LYNPA|nr:tho complex subunit 5 homolog [Lynx pardinus]
MEDEKIQSCVHFMTLKKLNRSAHIRLKKARDQTHEAKKKSPNVWSLSRSIEEIDLVSLEEFYTEAPPDISKAEVTIGDPHQQTLACLDWELQQKKRLTEKYVECLSSKEEIFKETEAHKQYETAKHLPSPLYILFVQAAAYDESDSDAEEEQTTKRQWPSLEVQFDDKCMEMLKRHLLPGMLDLKCKDDSVLHLTFYYLMNLNTMTIKAKVMTTTELITPSVQLCLNWKGEKNSSNDDNIQSMESEVIVCYRSYVPQSSHHLLTNQLQCLCVLLDVYLDVESHDDSVEEPKEFPQEMCLRLFRGPCSMKPFKYNQPQGFFTAC